MLEASTLHPRRLSAGQLSAVIYGTISCTAAVVFFAVTTLTGEYTWVARIGGAAWVFLLTLIILMPTVTPLVKARLRRERGPHLRTPDGQSQA